jgi:hypothetical protein
MVANKQVRRESRRRRRTPSTEWPRGVPQSPPGWAQDLQARLCSVCTPYTHTPERHAQRTWLPPPRPIKTVPQGKGPGVWDYLLLVSVAVVLLGLVMAWATANADYLPGP